MPASLDHSQCEGRRANSGILGVPNLYRWARTGFPPHLALSHPLSFFSLPETSAKADISSEINLGIQITRSIPRSERGGEEGKG